MSRHPCNGYLQATSMVAPSVILEDTTICGLSTSNPSNNYKSDIRNNVDNACKEDAEVDEAEENNQLLSNMLRKLDTGEENVSMSCAKPAVTDSFLLSKSRDHMCMAKHNGTATRDFELLIALSKGQLNLSPTLTNLNKLVLHTFTHFEAASKHDGLQFKLHLPQQPLTSFVDGNYVKLVVSTLLSNAVKFTNQGTIEIRLSQSGGHFPNQIFQIDVKDTGIGLESTDTEKYFNPPPMDVPYRKVPGFNLYISREIAKIFGGDIRVDSTSSLGSTFSFIFKGTVDSIPTAAPSSLVDSHVRSSAEPLSPNGKSNGKWNVLIVEDNLINQKLLANLLKKAGYNCFLAKNGEEGVQAYRTLKYRIIFMDIEMPVMNGFDATKCIRRFEAEVRIPSAFIICLTGIVQEDVIADSYAAGVDTYIAKPFDAIQITNMLHLTVQSFTDRSPALVHSPLSRNISVPECT